ncbi:hypothetical protein YC2023_064012 [Brassica napus]
MKVKTRQVVGGEFVCLFAHRRDELRLVNSSTVSAMVSPQSPEISIMNFSPLGNSGVPFVSKKRLGQQHEELSYHQMGSLSGECKDEEMNKMRRSVSFGINGNDDQCVRSCERLQR